MGKDKLRKMQVVIDELAKVVAELYAVNQQASQLHRLKCSLQYELDEIIEQEVNNK